MAVDPDLALSLVVGFPNDIDNIPLTRSELSELTARNVALRGPLPEGVSWSDEIVGLESGGPGVRVRIYRNDASTDPCGALLFFHGGAFVFGDLESEHERCLRFVSEARCVVVSVDYRLAPEHPFPAALNDGDAVLHWMRTNADDLCVDVERIAIGGASAGGALAAGLALRIRDEAGPPPRAQLLIYPALDDRANTPSMAQYYRHAPWDGERTEKMWRIYLGNDQRSVSPYAAPARATDFSGLAATYIMTAEEDPLRDEAVLYAQGLLESGVTVELHHYAHTFHGFDVLAPQAGLTASALREQSAFLERELAANH